MSWLARTSRALGLSSARGLAAREIDEEIGFHLEARARDLRADGLPPEDAARKAREMFGDPVDTARKCLRIQIGGLIMLQRIQWGIIAVLSVALVFLLVQSRYERAVLQEMAQAQQAEQEAVLVELQEAMRRLDAAAVEGGESDARTEEK